MTARTIAFLLMTTAASLAASNQDLRLDRLEQDVSELQSLVRQLGLRSGDRLQKSQSTPSHEGSDGYHVRPGDSYWSISRRLGTTVEALERANPGISPKRLKIGATLRIPGQQVPTPGLVSAPPPLSGSGNYTVQKNDTLGHISEAHGIRLHELLSANPGLDPKRLQIGKRLIIPGQTSPVIQEASKPVIDPAPKAKPATIEEFRPVPSPTQPDIVEAGPKTPLEKNPFERPKTILITVPANTRLSEIAKNHQTSVAALNQLNDVDLSSEQMIKAGSQLYIPGR